MTAATLKAAGCGQWDAQADGKALMLFPAEWYEIIPNGTLVESISGEKESFMRGVTDDDRRFGMLAYGFRVSV